MPRRGVRRQSKILSQEYQFFVFFLAPVFFPWWLGGCFLVLRFRLLVFIYDNKLNFVKRASILEVASLSRQRKQRLKLQYIQAGITQFHNWQG
jgi:hypothetical protein